MRSSERARSALEAAGAGWLDAGGDARPLLLFLVLSLVMVHSFQLAMLSQSDSSSDRAITYAGA